MGALRDISEMCTFLLPHAVGLQHVRIVDGGCRLVLDGFAWGAEFPERPDAPHSPSATAGDHQPVDHQALRDTVMLYDGVAMLR